MTKNRVQCSLVFPDDEVFDNLVLPLRDQRELSNFIVRLVTRYYESTEIQRLVSASKETEDNERNKLYSDINQSLAMINYLVSEGKNAVEDGVDAFDAIISEAEDKGVFVKDENGGVSRVNPDMFKNMTLIEEKDIPKGLPEKESPTTENKEELADMQAQMKQLQQTVQEQTSTISQLVQFMLNQNMSTDSQVLQKVTAQTLTPEQQESKRVEEPPARNVTDTHIVESKPTEFKEPPQQTKSTEQEIPTVTKGVIKSEEPKVEPKVETSVAQKVEPTVEQKVESQAPVEVDSTSGLNELLSSLNF